MRIPRGTARRFRRERWASIRVRESKIIKKLEYDKDNKPFEREYKIEGWSPTFAEFSRKEAARG